MTDEIKGGNLINEFKLSKLEQVLESSLANDEKEAIIRAALQTELDSDENFEKSDVEDQSR